MQGAYKPRRLQKQQDGPGNTDGRQSFHLFDSPKSSGAYSKLTDQAKHKVCISAVGDDTNNEEMSTR